MTRINCVPVTELTDQHLLAEYRELPRVFTLVSERFKKKNWPKESQLPQLYTLGAGHVTFFYNKLEYLAQRQKMIYRELQARGFKVKLDPDQLFTHHVKLGGRIPDWLWNNWLPTKEAQAVNRARIKERTTPRMKITPYVEEV